MGRNDSFADNLLRAMRAELRKHGKTIVRSPKTGELFVRHLTTHPVPEVTSAQEANRNWFGENAHFAKEWLRENGPEACPPEGTLAYQNLIRSFRRQHKIKRLLNYVMSVI